jgi:hypothetical protein
MRSVVRPRRQARRRPDFRAIGGHTLSDSAYKRRRTALDDNQLAELLAEVVAGWSIPPIRLDAPSWRDRVRTPRARRLADGGAWLLKVGRAGSAALALSVAGAMFAVLLTRSTSAPGFGGAPSASFDPRSGSAGASLLPTLLVHGDLPRPSEIVVQTEDGDFGRVDLADGTMAGSLTGAREGSELNIQSDGSMVCLCLTASGNANGSPTHIEARLDHFAADGRFLATTPITSYSGEPDPRRDSTVERPANVFVSVRFEEGGAHGFIGWSARSGTVWHSGVLIVDAQTGSRTGSLDLPDMSAGDGEARRVVNAPTLLGLLGSDGILIQRSWYEWTPAQSSNPAYSTGSEAFRLSSPDGRLADAVSLARASDCGEQILEGGPLQTAGIWLECTRGGSSTTVVRRLTADGSTTDDITLPGAPDVDGDTTALSPDGRLLFIWDPWASMLSRIDLQTGAHSSTGISTSRADRSLVDDVAEWLAPPMAAKAILRGAVVLSPDGSRVYAIGIDQSAKNGPLSGSSGVYVFDAATLATVDHWPPTADFVSLAVSPDGRFLYATGLPGVDAAGNINREQPASMTVFATMDGEVRIVAGRLGLQMITFPSAGG